MNLQDIVSMCKGVVKSGRQYKALCPAHEDKKPSMTVTEMPDGGKRLVCHAGCTTQQICDALGISPADLQPENPGKPRPRKKASTKKSRDSGKKFPFTDFKAVLHSVRTTVEQLGKDRGWNVLGVRKYLYLTATGTPAFAVLRVEYLDKDGKPGKEVRQASHRDGRWGLHGMEDPRPLYCLADILDPGRSEETVYVCEGEKAADAVRTCGLIATTSAGGTDAFEMTDWTPLAGREVCILPDNDLPGVKYAESVARLLATGLKCKVSIADLPGAGPGDDAHDFVENLIGKDEIHRMVGKGLTDGPRDELLAAIQASSQSISAATAVEEFRFPDHGKIAGEYFRSPDRKIAYLNDQWFVSTSGNGYIECQVAHASKHITDLLRKLFSEENDRKRKEFLAQGGELSSYKPLRSPSTTDVNEVLRSLEQLFSEAALNSGATNIPFWVSGPPMPGVQPRDAICCTNGTVFPAEIAAGRQVDPVPASHDLVTTWYVEWDYDSQAQCPEWLKFLESVWPGAEGQSSRDALQTAFGHTLLGRNEREKAFLMVGPPRSGKGTILHILRHLMSSSTDFTGRRVMGLSFDQLGSEFGLEPAANSCVLTFGEARLNGRNMRTTTTLLSATSGDDMGINRKGKQRINRAVSYHIWIASNCMPVLDDPSGVVASRFVLFEMENSYLGSEDQGLLERLRRELPGIFNWAIEGLRRYQNNGHRLDMPPQVSEDDLLAGTSAAAEFILDNFEIVPDGEAFMSADELWDLYSIWYEHTGRGHIKSRSMDRGNRRSVMATVTDIIDRKLRSQGITAPRNWRSGGASNVFPVSDRKREGYSVRKTVVRYIQLNDDGHSLRNLTSDGGF